MHKIYLSVLAVLIGGAALFFYATADESKQPRRRGVVVETVAPPSAPQLPALANVNAPLPIIRSTRLGNRLVIGRISTNVEKYGPRLQAMADYLSAELAAQGITGVDIRMTDTLEEMRELFRTGQVDLVSETAFGAIELERDSLSEMLLREWKGGVSSYTSVIFVRRDSGIDSLDDLIGRSIAFEDRSSTSAYLVPRSLMVRAGYNLVELDDPVALPPGGTIGFTFADENDGGGGGAVSMVLRGIATAGAMSNLDWSSLEDFTEEDRSKLFIIHVSDPIIRSIMLVRTSLDPAVKARLAAILERMHETEIGRHTLDRYSGVARYDRIDGEGLATLINARFMYETSGTF